MNRIWLILFGDFLSFWVSFFILFNIRLGNATPANILNVHLTTFSILYICWTIIFLLFGLYELSNIKPTILQIQRTSLALFFCFFIGISLFYLVPFFGITPKTNLLLQVIFFGFISFILRRIIYSFFSKQNVRKAILIGETNYINELYQIINTNPQIGLKIIYKTKDLQEVLKKYSNLENSVFIFESINQEIPDKEILNLYKNKVEIIDIAEAYEKYLFKIPIYYINKSWVIKNINTKKDFLYDSVSRFFNIIFSIFILIVTLPFTIISLIFIYLYDNGPVFYKQERIGLNGKIFELYKLRSMVLDSEKNGAVWSEQNDTRITPIGKIIRKIHIDEIPQMINILKGDIALVGPRPERPEFVSSLEKTIPYYNLRHTIRPGFTGWAQIKYRYARTVEDTKEKFQYDLYYMKNKNIFIDFGIILRTIQIIFLH
ncbi:MAG: exopolysaccharide biosynthesis polyprenyl glycosylphosphotransferase [Candidatus Nomurabacteria bacterium]|nr:exopolysaccharide biosynthesis polyprenyl glycosylphosphotransferase [Candidatus Nomurabacteria bacterium]